MQRHSLTVTLVHVIAVAIVNVLAIMLSINAVSAHAGHSHAEDGIGAGTILQLGGTVLLLGIAYLVVSHVYQAREADTPEPANRDDESEP